MRILFGIIWFFVFSILITVVAGAIAGLTAACPDGISAEELYACSQAAGEALGSRYGNLFILGGLVLAIAGTLLQILPGTKKRKK